MQTLIVVVTTDVFFWAKIKAAADARGTRAIRVADETGMEEAFRRGGVTRVLADLATTSVDLHAWARRLRSSPDRPEMIAHGAHVDAEALARAVEAGFDQAMPNSRFARLLDHLVS